MLKALSVGAVIAAVALTVVPGSAFARHRTNHVVAHNCKSAGHKGTAGGAILGALAGQAIGHNTTSTVVGAGVGAVAGHNIRYSNCRRRHG